jgi:hypothetical protein
VGWTIEVLTVGLVMPGPSEEESQLASDDPMGVALPDSDDEPDSGSDVDVSKLWA